MELDRRIARVKGPLEWVVIDEVQKAPQLLDNVHRHIEASSLKFVLTGSSTRKLVRGKANLLAGRVFMRQMHPLTHREMGEAFDLDAVLRWGSLPRVWTLSQAARNEFLRTYALTYVREEIAIEQVVRRLDPFRSFLEIASQANGTPINYSNIAKDVGVDTKTVQAYFQILEDTLIGFKLPPWHLSIRKQQSQAPKFFFFDLGVKRAMEHMLDVPVVPGTYGYGAAFEHFIIAEIRRLADRPGLPGLFVEVKSAEEVDERDTRTLEAFLSDSPAGTEGMVLSRCETEKKIGAVVCLPWQRGLVEMGL